MEIAAKEIEYVTEEKLMHGKSLPNNPPQTLTICLLKHIQDWKKTIYWL